MTLPRTPVGDILSLADRLRPVLDACRRSLHALAVGGENAEENVHFLRKSGKRLRGGLDMLGAPKPVLAELRDLGRLLSVSRDSSVRVITLRAVCQRAGDRTSSDPDFEVARRQLEFEAKLSGTPPSPARRFARDRLDAVAKWLDEKKFDNPAVVAKRMDRLVARSEQRFTRLARLAGKPKTLAPYHEARKAAKALLGAAQFLFDQPDKAQLREIERLDQLGDDFGWIQDLDVLRGWLVARGLHHDRLPELHRALAAEVSKACTVARRRAGKAAPKVFRVSG